MAIDPSAVGRRSAPATVVWDSKDSLLYALGVGAGADDAAVELEFTTENSAASEHRALPTMPVVIAPDDIADHPIETIGADLAKGLHGAQSVTLHRRFPPEGAASITSSIAAIFDKGSAAVVVIENEARDVDDGEPLFTTTTTAFFPGEGGWGGERGPSSARNRAPERPPDRVVRCRTRPDQALLYRLTGDRNPLHSDPDFAKGVGFDTPILHGLCTFGITGRALLHLACGGAPSHFKSMEGRFSTPVIPGETLDVRIWLRNEDVIYQTAVGERVVIDCGRLVLR